MRGFESRTLHISGAPQLALEALYLQFICARESTCHDSGWHGLACSDCSYPLGQGYAGASQLAVVRLSSCSAWPELRGSSLGVSVSKGSQHATGIKLEVVHTYRNVYKGLHCTMATMICPRAASLRALASTHRTISAVTPKQASFSSSTRPQKQRRLGEPSSRPSIALRIPKHRFAPVTRQSIRHESTSSAYRTPSAPNTASPPSDLLTWDRFFDLRKKRRYINLAASIATATATVAVAGPIIAQQDIDTWGAQVSGLDPFIVLGLTTFAAAAGGWLCGPSFGSAGFGIWAGRRGWNKAIAEVSQSNLHAVGPGAAERLSRRCIVQIVVLRKVLTFT